MSEAMRLGIVGYGNLGRGVELAIGINPDLALAGIYTRRDPASLQALTTDRVYAYEDLLSSGVEVDALVLCGGSKEDLPQQGPELAARYNTVDSFDTHARIPEYFAAVDGPARAGGHTALISTGWDPGLFSLSRVLGEAVLPQGDTYTFWGRGLSQGHSDAVRRLPGVEAAVQYTIPSESAIDRVRAGEHPELSTREKHRRECFVVLDAGADPDSVREAIVTMPHYFDEYDTTVNFISAEELERDHAAMPHGGSVIRSGTSSPGTAQVVEFSLDLESNPEFTASVLVACARAVVRLSRSGDHGAKTVFDLPFGLLSPRSPEQLRAELL